jgi:hypothetical protein
MPETMDDEGKEQKKTAEIPPSVEDEKLPYEDDSREYKPMRSRKPNGWLLIVAHRDTWHEFFPTPDARRIKLKPDGRELILEYSDCQVVVRGERLGLVATGITSKWCASIEAFSSDHHNKPTSRTEPFIESIRYYDPPVQKPKEPDPPAPKQPDPSTSH